MTQSSSSETLSAPRSHHRLAEAYLEALLAGDRHRAELLVTEAIASGSSLHDIYVDVFQASLYEVGQRWERSELSVAQEHFVTAATQHIMVSVSARMFQTPKSGRRLLATSIGGNFHSVGIRMLADVFEINGWATIYLGADTPSAAIVATLGGAFDVLAISAALDEHVPDVAELIDGIRASAEGQHLRILVGGRPFNADGELWRDVGADGHATTPEAALELADRLVATPRLITDRSARPIRRGPRSPRVVDKPTEDQVLLGEMSRLNNQLHDLTRSLAEKNAELERLNTQVNRLMGAAAHDLRNPLAVIAMSSEFLREDLGDALAPEHGESFDMIEESGAFMKSLLDDLLDMSRIRAGKLKLDVATIDLVGFVRKIVKLNGALAQRKQIALRFTTSETALELGVDAPKLQQLLNNLVGNAIQYSMAGSEIDVSLEATAGEVELVVRDRGKGIPEDELAKVFRPFETTSTRGTAGEKSTGLGLAIVQAIVDAHRGRVTVKSKLCEGTSFFVTLPRTPP
jgi:signal transduction histidine kinase